MHGNIAVIINEENELMSFETGNVLLVFGKESEGWQMVREIRYALDTTSDMAGMRDNIRNIISELGDCKIIVGKTISGLSYNIFDRLGFEIFEADSVSEDLMEEILNELEAEAAEVSDYSKSSPTEPVMTSDEGVYFLNLIQLQEKHPEISSKKALQSFIETAVFYRLDVICSHIPPWFDMLLPQKKLTYDVEELERNQLKVSITKKVCSC